MLVEKLTDSNEPDFVKKWKRLNKKCIVNSNKRKSIEFTGKHVNSFKEKCCDSKNDAVLMG